MAIEGLEAGVLCGDYGWSIDAGCSCRRNALQQESQLHAQFSMRGN
jgi:hypothetical protein